MSEERRPSIREIIEAMERPDEETLQQWDGIYEVRGCSTCVLAERRFNNGNGATTCAALGHRIVSYGHTVPESPPEKCPLKDGGTVTIRLKVPGTIPPSMEDESDESEEG